ncbi:type IV secretory system conjugative DNA transfer family protein [Mycoplasma sp. 'Moose RK']|uniref:type IV secretory system conjugative DNA transfer family protein n=1 Tax=Mycoplasma sp. 'Moose RK' TaxID=2780095 RepID=UPI0018C340CD|nr:type IV secretory system conjugative DNA transfer family protein [Mycoplasma sp. 'Moose RK']MBG0730488.1 type IV secretory system conjugative DNA transfer family protein [Mycoplasma sp. 'Moose RK']MBG0730742.1 type IV secretory system conjugative DNA transfer family protein [Mycoplasma sp. 'Moose RK']
MKIKIKKLPKWAQYLVIGLISYLISFGFTFFIWPFLLKYDISNIFKTFSNQIQDSLRMVFIISASFLIQIIVFPIVWFFTNLSNNKYSSELNSDFVFYDEVEKKGSKGKFEKLFLATDQKQEAGWVIKTSLVETKNKEIKYYILANSHAFILGDTRSGKTQKFIIPTIKYNIHIENPDLRPNLMIVDPKGELFTSLSQEMEQQGYEVVLLDFQNLGKSRGINFLAPIWDKFHEPYQNEAEKLQNYDIASNWLEKVIESVNEWDTDGKNNFWSSQAKNILYAVGWYLLLYSNLDKTFTREKYVFSNFVYFLSFETFTGGAWIEVCKHTQDKLLFTFCQEKITPLVNTNPETLTSILVNAYGAVSKFNSLGLKMFSSKDETNFDNLVQQSDIDFKDKFNDKIKPFAVFITFQLDSNIGQLMIPSIINNCYSSLITIASSKPNRKNFRPFLFLGDEFGNLPKIWQMATKMSTAASYGIYFGLVLQNIQQLEKYGKESDTILSNSALKIYFRSNDLKSLEAFAKFAGKKPVIKKSYSNSEKKDKSESVSEQLIEEDIVTVNKLAQMPPDESWIFITGLKPIHIRSDFAYQIWQNPQKSLESFYFDKKSNFDFEFIEFNFENSSKLLNPDFQEQENEKRKEKWENDNKRKEKIQNLILKRKTKLGEKKDEKGDLDKSKELILEKYLEKNKQNNLLQKEIIKLVRETELAQQKKQKETDSVLLENLNAYINQNQNKIQNLYKEIKIKKEPIKAQKQNL